MHYGYIRHSRLLELAYAWCIIITSFCKQITFLFSESEHMSLSMVWTKSKILYPLLLAYHNHWSRCPWLHNSSLSVSEWLSGSNWTRSCVVILCLSLLWLNWENLGHHLYKTKLSRWGNSFSRHTIDYLHLFGASRIYLFTTPTSSRGMQQFGWRKKAFSRWRKPKR